MNNVHMVGVVYEEPVKYEKNGRIHARTILKVRNAVGRISYIPITLRGANADKFTVLAHRNSVVSIEGEVETNVYNAPRLKRAIEIQIFATDFVVLRKTQMVTEKEKSLEYVVKLYDPERYLK